MLIIIYILSFVFSILLTNFVRKIALKKNILDEPNERSSHSHSTPRGGGLAIVIVWYIGLVFLYYMKIIEVSLFKALLSGIILAIISFLDDIFNLNSLIRFISQLFTSILALFFLGGYNFQLPFNSSYFLIIAINLIVIIGIIWFINLFNFLDGLDGYASQEAIMILFGVFIITKNSITILLILIIIGFLYWNWPRAKIFMGDVGSTQLGFIIIVLGIHFQNLNQLNILLWLALTSLFWFDATITLIRRIFNNESFWVAHKKHAYQRLNQGGYSHKNVLSFAFVINTFFILITCLGRYYMISNFLILSIALIINTASYISIEKIYPFNKK